jgi:hypothetical protein
MRRMLINNMYRPHQDMDAFNKIMFYLTLAIIAFFAFSGPILLLALIGIILL